MIFLAVIAFLIPLLLPRLLGYNTLHVISGSMEPNYPIGSMVLIDKVEADRIAVDDVIAFRASLPDGTPGGALTLHRVIEVNAEDREFVTKGDANPVEDIYPVPFDALEGVAVRVFPRLGGLYALLTSLWGKIMIGALVIIAALLAGAGKKPEQEPQADAPGDEPTEPAQEAEHGEERS